MAETMTAVVAGSAGGPEVLQQVEAPVPSPGPGEVSVAVRAIAVNFRDVQQRRGEETAFPAVLGSDFAGEVLDVGDGVASLRPGQQVYGVSLAGAYAEQVVVPEVTVSPLPDGLDFDTASILPVAGLSASFLLSVSRLGAGATAVTWAAAGGLGCFLGGVLAGAGVRSIGLTSTAAKAEAAKAAGHLEVVNYREVDPVAAVQDLTGGAGAEVVFDSVAGPDFARSFRMLRNEGTVVLCGRSAGDPDLGRVYEELVGRRRNLALREFYLGTHYLDHMDEVPGRLDALVAGLRSGRIRVPIRVLPLAEAATAHRLLEAGEVVGKVVLHP